MKSAAEPRSPYVVVAGDTLTAIAQKNNVSLADLMRWNNIQDPNLIRVGQQLILKY